MAIDTYINVSKQGGKTAGGKQASLVNRGAAASGHATVAYDSAVVTTKGDLLQLINDALVTSGLK